LYGFVNATKAMPQQIRNHVLQIIMEKTIRTVR
jgi:hypothetical protein